MLKVGDKLWPVRVINGPPQVQVVIVRNGIIDKIIDASDIDLTDPNDKFKTVLFKQSIIDAIYCAKG